MKKIILSLFCALFIITNIHAQHVVSTTYIGSKTKDSITALFGLPFFRCGADYYKIDYTSFDAKGQPDTLSGLLAVPSDTSATYPVLMYEHGTSSCKTCVPSRFEQTPGGSEGQVGLLFAGLGFVTLLPDYVGMGDGRGFQTYVHDTTIVSASDDLLKAFKAWAPNNKIKLNNQLFITGYSQGGYAAMAFHKYMQETYGPSAVTAAADNSGPYSLSGVMRDLIITDSVYMYPGYIPNTALGLNEYYGIFSSIGDFFKAPFVPDIQKYYDGVISLTDLNTRLFDTLISTTGDTIAHDMIIDSIFLKIKNDPDYIVNKALRYNDVYNWVPLSPTRLFYCKADNQVPYKNAVVTIDTMYALGADPNLVKAKDVDSTLNHAECVTPAFTQTVLFFLGYQQTTLGVTKFDKTVVKIYPNPADTKLYIKGNATQGIRLSIWDMGGGEIISNQAINPKKGVDVSRLRNGLYIVQFKSNTGGISYQRLVVRH